MAFFLGANDQSLYLDRITFLYEYHPPSCEDSIPRTSNLERAILPHAMYPPNPDYDLTTTDSPIKLVETRALVDEKASVHQPKETNQFVRSV